MNSARIRPRFRLGALSSWHACGQRSRWRIYQSWECMMAPLRSINMPRRVNALGSRGAYFPGLFRGQIYPPTTAALAPAIACSAGRRTDAQHLDGPAVAIHRYSKSGDLPRESGEQTCALKGGQILTTHRMYPILCKLSNALNSLAFAAFDDSSRLNQLC
jgi:hypothetical protein